MSDKQSLYKLALRDKHLMPVIAYGSAGTGKTYNAADAAVEWVQKNKGKAVVIRPNVSFAQTNGFLPGTEREKMLPWIRPVLEYFEEFTNKATVESWENKGKLVFKPLEHIQGLTFNNSFIILDECQNMTFDQLKVFLTRTGTFSKVVMCGDVRQVSPKFQGSGLQSLINMIKEYDLPVHTIEFTPEDIVRSEQCKMWINAFEEWENKKGG